MNICLKLYAQDGLTLRYTFPLVQYINVPQTIKNFVEISGNRGNNAIIIEGSERVWDLNIRGYLRGDGWDYEDVTNAIDALETALQFAQPYYIKLDKVDGGASTYTYKVKRLQPIVYTEGKRSGRGVQEYNITLRVNAW